MTGGVCLYPCTIQIAIKGLISIIPEISVPLRENLLNNNIGKAKS